MEGLKISVLFYEIRSDGMSEHDYVVEQVSAALTEGKHKVSLLSISDDLRELITKLDEQKPDIVFNLCETFASKDVYEMNITAVLEMLGQRFTGTGPVGMALRQDKAVTKKLLKFYDVQCPNYAIFDKNHLEFAGRMRFPLFIKPLKGDASLCIDDFSLVTEYSKLMERVGQIQEELSSPALVEEYIDGREFYVCILGNDQPEVLPLVEMDFSKLAKGYPRIYGWQAKFDASSAQYDGTDAVVAKDLSPEIQSRITKAGKEAANAVQVNDYARVDIRLSPDGIPYVVEVNANPYLEQTSEFATAALAAGISYPTLINQIVETAWKRWNEHSRPKMTPRQIRAAIRKRTSKNVPACKFEPEIIRAPETTKKEA